MNFLYKYYFTFYCQHAKDKWKDGGVWAFTLCQVTLGCYMLLFGIILIVAYYLGFTDSLRTDQNPLLFSIVSTALAYQILYYLLFKKYEVSKEDGRTARQGFSPNLSWRIFFWMFWFVSCLLPVIVGLVENGYTWSNLNEIPWSPASLER